MANIEDDISINSDESEITINSINMITDSEQGDDDSIDTMHETDERTESIYLLGRVDSNTLFGHLHNVEYYGTLELASIELVFINRR